MKHTLLFAALGLVGFGAAAQEVGNVISSHPVVQQVAVPRQNCAPAYVQAPPQTSGMGGLAGAIAGAAIGSQIGGGAGTAAAMIAGTVGGALLGNNVEANNMRAQQAMVPNCITENTIENRTVGYDVTYEYGGRQYTTRMPYDPGSTIRLSVTPVAQGAVTAPPVQGIAAAPGTVVAAAAPTMVVPAAPVVVQPYPVYPAYPYPVYRPYYPPIGLSLGFVFRGGGHHHWR
jgi:uncharacterized protein YcfJ